MQLYNTKGLKYAFCGTGVAIVLYVFYILSYLYSEFITCTHTYYRCTGCDVPDIPKDIPTHIHQVFFFETSPELPADLRAARQTCLDLHPGYGYTLWNKTTVNQLIDAHYPDIRELYESYDHWVKRADVARYLVIHHYGGWYLDMDIKCKMSLEEVRTNAQRNGSTVVVRPTDPNGFSNDFIGATPRHPFMSDVINSLRFSNKWFIFPYPSTVFVTGPTYFWGRYLNYPRHEQFYIVNNYTSYLHLLHGSSWHTWDGDVIWYFFNRAGQFWGLLLTSLTVFLLAWCCVNYRRNKNRKSNTNTVL
ncbi:uncharacterized protein LOC127831636 [Dreissena polymorpha]|uniref:Uncharacterized protein n=1 Tax=Dreissena polymorpha TaxID=45954 RepID=A0A9D4JVV3_DREPO|nr:uncharacterized protein LOC127831636 [Dreissena polymorpha]XP_052212581.1 uncharacterized protein LOC127831636 [Dreissena polymorpha]XP_052212582.1 uncharacterized protein LOC127831636 [Dreissena polymorpha]XP_052212584.1 uncharacterized protein LOC127831636 [Dreissena polymorpha]XP_052212585.1 uncharacterized protein LOC127831636 [Dreissena polymorpha]XP_052212586.1 uncharacterized protein LOC127831636 [Dreissena polymorpha]XP_052212587.1 uncharacterized protein LOC127831636 [Dreissena po